MAKDRTGERKAGCSRKSEVRVPKHSGDIGMGVQQTRQWLRDCDQSRGQKSVAHDLQDCTSAEQMLCAIQVEITVCQFFASDVE